MSSNSDAIQKELVTIFNLFAANVATLNEQGKNDWAKSAELLYKDLLPIVFGQEFEMPIRVNNDTFDLRGEAVGQERVLVQVTSRTDAAKIKEALKKYIANGHAAQYGKLYFVLIARCPKFQKETFAAHSKVFEYKEQIIGISELVARISAKGIDALNKAHEIAVKHLCTPDAHIKAENERLLESILHFQKDLIASQGNVNMLLQTKLAISGHDDAAFTQGLERTQGVLQLLRNLLKGFHATVNSDIGHSHEPIRLHVANFAQAHLSLMGDFAHISGSESRIRDLARLIQKLESQRKVIDEAQAELDRLAQEEKDVNRERESALFALKLLGHQG